MYIWCILWCEIFFAFSLSLFNSSYFYVCANFMLLSRVYWHRVTDRDRMCKNMCEPKVVLFFGKSWNFSKSERRSIVVQCSSETKRKLMLDIIRVRKSWFSLTILTFPLPFRLSRSYSAHIQSSYIVALCNFSIQSSSSCFFARSTIQLQVQLLKRCE